MIAAMIDRTITGRLIRKVQPHQCRLRIQPPRIGPSGMARKLAAAQIPTARERSAVGNSTVRVDSTSGTTKPAARPSSA